MNNNELIENYSSAVSLYLKNNKQSELINFRLEDNADGKGIIISDWKYSIPEPTNEQLKEYTVQECKTTSKYIRALLNNPFLIPFASQSEINGLKNNMKQGFVVYNTDTNNLSIWDGSSWKSTSMNRELVL